MDTRDRQYSDRLMEEMSKEGVSSPLDVARVLSLYVKMMNDNGLVSNFSLAYMRGYDGKRLYRRFASQFDRLYEMFLRNGIGVSERHDIFKRVARRVSRVPGTKAAMQSLSRTVIEETSKFLKSKRLLESKRGLISRFSKAVKKYLGIAYELGWNEPSACFKSLAASHKIDKYIMSGDFPVMLLPFLPDLEAAIKSAYENYEMKDAWEVIKGRYFNHKGEYSVLALEIKSAFNKAIPNFSDYFDRIYTDTYYKQMLELGGSRKERKGAGECVAN